MYASKAMGLDRPPDAAHRRPVKLRSDRLMFGNRLPNMLCLIFAPKSQKECTDQYNL